MATFYIAEFVGSNVLKGGGPIEPPLTEQTVAISGASAQSAALNAKTTSVRVTSDTVCSFAVGASAAATVASRRIAAGVAEWLSVPEASGFKIATIANT